MGSDPAPPLTSPPPEGWGGPVPGWPACAPGERVVFLVDASSRLERRMLRRWIETACPDDFASERVEVIDLPASRRGRRRKLDASLEAALASPAAVPPDDAHFRRQRQNIMRSIRHLPENEPRPVRVGRRQHQPP